MDLSKLKPTGAEVVSVAVMALWAAHVLGFAPGLSPDNAEVLKAAVYSVLGYWIGSAAPSTLRGAATAAAAAAIPTLAEAAPLLPAALETAESLFEKKDPK